MFWKLFATKTYMRGRRDEWQRTVRIIKEIVDREMNSPIDKDKSARLAANVFIAAISYEHTRS